MCPDQSCILNGQTYVQQQKCPDEKPFNCEDQTCVKEPKDYPTRITYPNFGQVICPDKTCVSNALECSCLDTCETRWLEYPDGTVEEVEFLQCADGFCIQSRDNCPKSKRCGDNLAFCLNNSCRDVCTEFGAVETRELQDVSVFLTFL